MKTTNNIFILLGIMLLCNLNSHAQENRYGVNLGFKAVLNYSPTFTVESRFLLSVSPYADFGGWATVALQNDIVLSHGSFGTSVLKKGKWYLENLGAIQLTLGGGQEEQAIFLKNTNNSFGETSPLFREYAFTISSHFNYHSDNKVLQRNWMIQARAKYVRLGMYNDGPPLAPQSFKLFGDGNDRWYTGGGFVQVDVGVENNLYQLGWQFDKYTGHVPHSFEVANDLQLEGVIHNDDYQNSKNTNRSTFFVGMSSQEHLLRLNYSLYDQKSDIQDWIHKMLTENPVFLSGRKPGGGLGLEYQNLRGYE